MQKIIFLILFFPVLPVFAQVPQTVFDPTVYGQLIDQYENMKKQLDKATETLQEINKVKEVGEATRDEIRTYREMISKVYNGTYGMVDSFTNLSAALQQIPEDITTESWKTLGELGCISDDMKKYSKSDRIDYLSNMSPREYSVYAGDGRWNYVKELQGSGNKVVRIIDIEAYRTAIKARENDKCNLSNDVDQSSAYKRDAANNARIKERLKDVLREVNAKNERDWGSYETNDDGSYQFENGQIKRKGGTMPKLLEEVNSGKNNDIQKQIFLLNQMIAQMMLTQERLLQVSSKSLEVLGVISLPKETAKKNDNFVMPILQMHSVCESSEEFKRFCFEQRTAPIPDTTSPTAIKFYSAMRSFNAEANKVIQEELERSNKKEVRN